MMLLPSPAGCWSPVSVALLEVPGLHSRQPQPQGAHSRLLWTLGVHLKALDVHSCQSQLPLHCNENANYIFLFWELRSLSPNFHIHVSVSDLYIPRIIPHIS
jgi:hypothetical protein